MSLFIGKEKLSDTAGQISRDAFTVRNLRETKSYTPRTGDNLLKTRRSNFGAS
jgi:hypothetical protein